MTSYDIAQAKGGDVFNFDYSDVDLAGTFTYDMNDWGNYLIDEVSVTDAIRPEVADDLLSLPGTWTVSIPLQQFDNVSSVRLNWVGEDVTVEYTLGSGWTAVDQNEKIVATETDDLDVRVSFDGGITDDPAHLESLTAYVLDTDTLYSNNQLRPLTIDNATVGEVFEGSGTVGVAPEAADIIGTIEMWGTPTTTTPLTTPSATTYTNGSLATPTAGVRQHIIKVLTTEANASFSIVSSEVEHLAVYPYKMTAGEIDALYDKYQGIAAVSVIDSSTIEVTEGSPVTKISAYVWTTDTG